MTHCDKPPCRALAIGILMVVGACGTFTSAAEASGTSMSWNTFRGEPGATQGTVLACSHADASHRLVATFTSPAALADFDRLEAQVRIGYLGGWPPPPPTPLSPFWHFEQTGCNEGGIALGDAKPAGGAGVSNVWGSQGQFGEAFLMYSPDQPRPGIGTLLVEIVRTSPVALETDRPYFAFTLDLSMCAAPSCDGCGEMMGLELLRVRLHGSGGAVVDIGDGNGEGFVCTNQDGPYCYVTRAGADPAGVASDAGFLPVPQNRADACDPTPARPSNWGELKIRYR